MNQPGSLSKLRGELSTLLRELSFLNGIWNSFKRTAWTGIIKEGHSGGGSPYWWSLCSLCSTGELLVPTFELCTSNILSWGEGGGDDNNGILSLVQATWGKTDLGEFTGFLIRGLRLPFLPPVWGKSPEGGVVLLEGILGSGDVHPRNSADTLSSQAEEKAPKS